MARKLSRLEAARARTAALYKKRGIVGGPPPTADQAAVVRRRKAETASRRERLALANAAKARIGGSAYGETRELLRGATSTKWTSSREKPDRYWDESWTFKTRGDASYDELSDWRRAIARDPVVSRYMETRAVSVAVDVTGADGEKLTLTAAGAAHWGTALDRLDRSLERWTAHYGREVGEDNDEGHTRIRSVTILIRRHEVDARWGQVVRGRVEAREAKERETRARKAKRARRRERRER